jgi:hypothetical protein
MGTVDEISTNAEAGVFALLAVLADPAAFKKRLGELVDATRALEAERAAADETASRAASRADVEAKLAALAQREADFTHWVERESKRLKKADADLRLGEEQHAERVREFEMRESDLHAIAERHQEAVNNLRAALPQ